MYLEGQTQFGDIPWRWWGSAGSLLDSAQSVAHGIGMAEESFSGGVYRPIALLPCPKRFEQ
jgi:hypothetical protein